MLESVAGVVSNSSRHVGPVFNAMTRTEVFRQRFIGASDRIIKYRIYDGSDYENNLLTDVFPSWFFFNTYQ